MVFVNSVCFICAFIVKDVVVMRKIIDIIVLVTGMVLSIIVIYMTLLKLTGHSPTLDQMNSGFIAIMVVALWRVEFYLGRYDLFMARTGDDIKEVRDDVKELRIEVKSELKEMNQKFEKMNEKFDKIMLKLAKN